MQAAVRGQLRYEHGSAPRAAAHPRERLDAIGDVLAIGHGEADGE